VKIGIVHRAWFGVVFAVYVAFLALIPPFQSNDEDAHWQRMWTVAEGHITCQKIPRAAVAFSQRFDEVRATSRMTPELWRLRVRGTPYLIQPGGAPCMYIPLSYVMPAMLARLVANPLDPSRSARMMLAFYVARAFNLLLLAVGVLVFMRAAPALRSLTLTLYSLPMAIQQSISINQESTILCLAFCVLALWWSRPSVRQSLFLLAAVTGLALTKPTYLVLLLLWAGSLLRLRGVGVPWRRIAALSTLVLIPLGAWGAWSYFVAGRPEALRYLPGWVVLPAQIDWVKEHPIVLWRIVVIQFQDLFGRDHLRGGWTSVLGVLGWADYEIGERAYRALLAAVPLAMVADFLARPGLPPDAPEGERRGAWAYLLPIVAAVLIIPGITIALYFQFNAPQADYAMGMTGRYLHVPYFTVLASLVLWARGTRLGRRVAERAAQRPYVAAAVATLALLLCALSAHDAMWTIWAKYHG
jgi:hypothetical protein